MLDIKHLERILKALANRRRLAILQFLKKEKEANVSDIAEAINLSFRATSKHLGILAAADLVEREQRGLQMWYKIMPKIYTIARSIIFIL